MLLWRLRLAHQRWKLNPPHLFSFQTYWKYSRNILPLYELFNRRYQYIFFFFFQIYYQKNKSGPNPEVPQRKWWRLTRLYKGRWGWRPNALQEVGWSPGSEGLPKLPWLIGSKVGTNDLQFCEKKKYLITFLYVAKLNKLETGIYFKSLFASITNLKLAILRETHVRFL